MLTWIIGICAIALLHALVVGVDVTTSHLFGEWSGLIVEAVVFGVIYYLLTET